jgi:hypothetical protein
MARLAFLWRVIKMFVINGWPIVYELVEHGLDGDGMTREEWHHAIDSWCDKRGMP